MSDQPGALRNRRIHGALKTAARTTEQSMATAGADEARASMDETRTAVATASPAGAFDLSWLVARDPEATTRAHAVRRRSGLKSPAAVARQWDVDHDRMGNA